MNCTAKTLVTVIMALASAKCERGSGTVQIDVNTKSEDGKPIAGALITLDDVEIGQTNAFGTFSTSISTPANKRHALRISKDDQSYYYAPHLETFRADLGRVAKITVHPTLYVVPKPRSKHLTQNSEKPADAKSQKPLTSESPQTVPESPRLPLLQISPSDLAADSAIGNSPQQRPRDSWMFTAHIYSGRAPLENASVSWIDSDGGEASCLTNNRGRCVLRPTSRLSAHGSLIVQHEGFKSHLKTITPSFNDNVRVSLVPGLSIDLKALDSGPFSSKPMVNAEITLNDLPVGKTNEQGLAIIDPAGPLPATMTLRRPGSRSDITIDVENAADSKPIVNFSDAKTGGWTKKLVYTPHADQQTRNALAGVNTGHISDSLTKIIAGQKTPLSIDQLGLIEYGAIGILPIIENQNNHVQIRLLALSREGIIAASDAVIVRSPRLSESWQASISTASEGLMSRLPWPGTVIDATRGNLTLAINPQYTKKGDLVTIELGAQSKNATVKSVQGATVIASLNDPDQLAPTRNWRISGARVYKVVNNDTSKNSKNTLLQDLRPLNDEDTVIRLAKKYLAENNPEQALKALNESAETDAGSIARLQLGAVIAHNSRDISSALKSMTSIMRLTAKNNLQTALQTARINRLRLEAENFPVIPGDASIIGRLDELTHELAEVKSGLAGPLSNIASPVIEYARLVTLRKRSECAGDEITIATMDSMWSDFERDIKSNAAPGDEQNTWMNHIQAERAKVALTPGNPNQSM